MSVPYARRPPPAARLHRWPLRERDGVLLVYHHPHGAAPDWEVPPLGTDGWSPLAYHRFTVRGHPQETTENGVDVAHFAAVHGYRELAELTPVATRGPHLEVRYRMARPVVLRELSVEAAFTIHVHGLGYSRVEVELPRLGLSLRQFVFATPGDAGELNMRLAVSVDERTPAPLGPRLARIAGPVLARLVGRVVLAMFKGDVAQDSEIWAHKRYVAQPALAPGDGPIALYRRWARQFYFLREA